MIIGYGQYLTEIWKFNVKISYGRFLKASLFYKPEVLVKHLSNETNSRVCWFIKGELQIPRSESDTADSKTLIIIYYFPVQSSYPQNAPSGLRGLGSVPVVTKIARWLPFMAFCWGQNSRLQVRITNHPRCSEVMNAASLNTVKSERLRPNDDLRILSNVDTRLILSWAFSTWLVFDLGLILWITRLIQR